MTTVTPPPPHRPQSTVQGAVSAQAAIVAAAKSLDAWRVGHSLEAVATQLKLGNLVQLETPLGQLTLQTAMAVAKGATLTLTLTQITPPMADIVAINGKPVAGQANSMTQATGQAAAQTTWSSSQGVQSPPQPLLPGQTVTATLLRPALGQSIAQPTGPSVPQAGGAAAATPAQAAAKPGGTSSADASVGKTPSTAPGQPQDGSAAPGRATAAMTAQGTPKAQASGTPSSPSGPFPQGASQPATLPAGTRFAATVQKVDTPSAAVAAAAAKASAPPLAQGQVLSGAITGRLATGQPIVQTPAATFTLGASGQLDEGTSITFRLDSGPQAPSKAGPSLGHVRSEADSLTHAKSWPDLAEALKGLLAADPERLSHVANRALPQAGAKLSSQMLFFLTALKGGDVGTLLGDTAARLVEGERPGLLAKMGGDFQIMSKLADEPQTGDWRLALIPFWTGAAIEQMRVFWRNGAAPDAEDAGKETRFVLDIDLSNIGHLQVDGLVKDKRRQIDLIIRTDQPLPEAMRADIAEIVQVAQETTGFGGQVAFQAKPANFVPVPSPKPSAPPSSDTRAGGVIA